MEIERKLAWKIMGITVMAFTLGLLIGVIGMMLVHRLRDRQNLDGNSLFFDLALQERFKVGDMNQVRQAAYIVCALEAKDNPEAARAASETVIAGLVRLGSLEKDQDVLGFLKELEGPAAKSPALRHCLDEAKHRRTETAKGN